MEMLLWAKNKMASSRTDGRVPVVEGGMSGYKTRAASPLDLLDPSLCLFFFFLNLSGPRGEQATRLASSPGLVVWGKRSH